MPGKEMDLADLTKKSLSTRIKGMPVSPRKKNIALALCFSFVTILVTNTPVFAGSKCSDLLKKRCQSCHSLNTTCVELGRDKERWQRTIRAMANYSPAITDKEQNVLVKCLAKQKKDVLELCR